MLIDYHISPNRPPIERKPTPPWPTTIGDVKAEEEEEEATTTGSDGTEVRALFHLEPKYATGTDCFWRADDDDDYRRGSYQRRNDPPPVHIRLRKQLLTLAESPLRRGHEEAQAIGQLVGTAEEPEAREVFINTALQLVVEQPLKTPFVAAVIQVANAYKPDIVEEILAKLSASIERQIQAGQWRDVKLNLKLVACLQSCLLGEGIFPLLEALFERAVQLQTASSEDVSCALGSDGAVHLLTPMPSRLSVPNWSRSSF
jgi:nuclear cap-binding protein subunit 1